MSNRLIYPWLIQAKPQETWIEANYEDFANLDQQALHAFRRKVQRATYPYLVRAAVDGEPLLRFKTEQQAELVRSELERADEERWRLVQASGDEERIRNHRRVKYGLQLDRLYQKGS